MKKKPIIIVQGAQWGSEAKGMVSAAIGRARGVKYAVRTGTVNAGHTVYFKGKPYKMQQLPAGWVHGADLVIGPGAYIHPHVFYSELKMVREAGFQGEILVDTRCGLHLPRHTDRSTVSGRHYSMGATGKGCSEAVIDKISGRGSGGGLFRDYPQEPVGDWQFTDTVELLNGAYDAGVQILIEGTQGTMLDLHLGPYPFTTHKQSTAAAWITEAGLSPNLDYEIALVARTFPIRVAGNSGPMRNEITWPALACEINAKLQKMKMQSRVKAWALDKFHAAWHKADQLEYRSREHKLSEQNRLALEMLDEPTREELGRLFEFTTVTKKLRRVARLDLDLLAYSCMINRPNYLVLTFLNYVYPELWGETALPNNGPMYHPIKQYIAEIERKVGVPIMAVTTGPEDQHFHLWPGAQRQAGDGYKP